MIDPKSRSKEWILESCGKNKVNDPTLMEKTIRAFSLLGEFGAYPPRKAPSISGHYHPKY